MAGISHIVIDEVHERDVYTDCLLVIVREILQCNTSLRVMRPLTQTYIPGMMHEKFASLFSFSFFPVLFFITAVLYKVILVAWFHRSLWTNILSQVSDYSCNFLEC